MARVAEAKGAEETVAVVTAEERVAVATVAATEAAAMEVAVRVVEGQEAGVTEAARAVVVAVPCSAGMVGVQEGLELLAG